MSLKHKTTRLPPLAVTATCVGDYVTVTYADGEVARCRKAGFIAPLCMPDFLKVEIIDEGQTLKMGTYEACTDRLYELYVEDGLED